MSPVDNNFRGDDEFLKMIRTLERHENMISNLSTKIDENHDVNQKNFDHVNSSIKDLNKTLVHSQENCQNFTPPSKNPPKAIETGKKWYDDYNSPFIKTLVVIFVSICGYIFGTEISPLK